MHSDSAFTDPSGGRHDAFTICIGHREGTSNLFFVADVIRGVHPPFDPHDVVAEYAALCRDYRITSIVGDNFSADWCSTAFEKAGIRHVRSEQTKSELYLEAVPQFARQALSIPNHPKLIRELRLLKRRTSRVGRRRGRSWPQRVSGRPISPRCARLHIGDGTSEIQRNIIARSFG